MTAPQLRLVRDPRSPIWGEAVTYGLPHSLLLNWLDHPNDGEPGFLMPGILWAGFEALGLTQVLFFASLDEAPAPAYRHFRQGLVMAEGKAAFLDSFEIDGPDSWHSAQCYFGTRPGQPPARSDPDLDFWEVWPRSAAGGPAKVPRRAPLMIQVSEAEDAAWALAFAESGEILDTFETALEKAAQGAGVLVSKSSEGERPAPEHDN